MATLGGFLLRRSHGTSGTPTSSGSLDRESVMRYPRWGWTGVLMIIILSLHNTDSSPPTTLPVSVFENAHEAERFLHLGFPTQFDSSLSLRLSCLYQAGASRVGQCGGCFFIVDADGVLRKDEDFGVADSGVQTCYPSTCRFESRSRNIPGRFSALDQSTDSAIHSVIESAFHTCGHSIHPSNQPRTQGYARPLRQVHQEPFRRGL